MNNDRSNGSGRTSVDNATASSKKELPRTGSETNHLFILIGVILLLSSLSLLQKAKAHK
ncbi:LPXTG cell wall anchor domain-containing protein [Enterococcus florum]|uniref:LPXTG cell wall anchor domain-containing protein n=1 Tax=Enterococcus florum TaxID=2480627 RepID=UPI00158C0DC1